ncbi:hypothetical protein PoB_005798300 [Plakobranchus ocellatus]|uniref:Uncharacterized protein n=1 Tax=Plakobranchus ocellatus TaxID=259542 RepID=A0AAV4CHP3_9GAST|nr:hypothetical protein PoB_005798300 [Plakobranchus ocellatus]
MGPEQGDLRLQNLRQARAPGLEAATKGSLQVDGSTSRDGLASRGRLSRCLAQIQSHDSITPQKDGSGAAAAAAAAAAADDDDNDDDDDDNDYGEDDGSAYKKNNDDSKKDTYPRSSWEKTFVQYHYNTGPRAGSRCSKLPSHGFTDPRSCEVKDDDVTAIVDPVQNYGSLGIGAA